MCNLLPNRPFPFKDESLSGYATRLAEANFWPNPVVMFRDMKLKPFASTQNSSANLKNALIYLSGHKKKINAMRFTKNLSVFDSDIDRCFRRIESFSPKICVECIKEDGYIKNDVSFNGLDHCLKHQVQFLKACPECGNKFAWNSDLLSLTCSHCQTAIKQAKNSPAPKYLAYIYDHSAAERIRIVQDLFLCTQRIIRPLDSIIDIREHVPEFDNWSEILECAYEQLNDTTQIKEWISYQAQHRNNLQPIGSNAVFLPLLILQQSLRHKWPIVDVNPANVEANDDYIPKFSNECPIPKFRLVNNPSDCLLQQQVGTNALKLVLGGDDFTIWKLVEAGIVKPIKEVRVMRSAIFQLDEIVNMITACYQKNDANVLNRKHYRERLPNALLSDLDILTRISNKKLTGSAAKSGLTTLDMFDITSTCYEELYEESIQKLRNMTISSCTVKTILNLDIRELTHLLNTGQLHTEIINGRRVFKGQEIVSFMQSKALLINQL